MKLRAIIVEDEANSREILRSYLADYCPEVLLEGEAASMDEGLALIGKKDPDLVFLDVEMPGFTGFDIIRKIHEASLFPDFVFVTGYDQYSLPRCPPRCSDWRWPRPHHRHR